jgi:hypothetical protein
LTITNRKQASGRLRENKGKAIPDTRLTYYLFGYGLSDLATNYLCSMWAGMEYKRIEFAGMNDHLNQQ